jgi:cysteine-rich repeat protein
MCGDGTLQTGCSEECDDGNLVADDGCSPTCHIEFACGPTPATGCRVPFLAAKASVQFKDKTPNSKDRAQWKWAKGSATTLADFGTPLTTTEYVLCVYANGARISRAHIPAGGICTNGKPCWQAKKTGFKYKNKLQLPNGIQQMIFKAGIDGKAQIQVKGGGDNFQMPTPPLTQPVRVQLKASNGICWEATYSAPAQKNIPGMFKDKAD